MKSFLNRNCPWLAKWFSFFQQEERTFGYKEIKATELQKICNLLNSSLQGNNTNKFDRAYNHIREACLEENIALEKTSDSPSDKIEIGITFKDLKVTGDVAINFPLLKEIKFQNNIFLDKVKIAIKGATMVDVAFDGNKFSKRFNLTVVDAASIFMKNNDIFHRMDMHINFTPLSDATDHRKNKKTLGGIQIVELFIAFSNNKVNHLHIRDVHDNSEWNQINDYYPLEKIVFSGGNYIKILEINTKHTTLIPYTQLKADVNRISFSASDKIGISPPGIDLTSDKDNKDVLAHGEFPLTYGQFRLTYGQFFSSLETQASKQHDRESEDTYRRKARYFNKKFLLHREDRFIFGWTSLASKDGTSWLRPLFLLAITETSLAVIAYYFFVGWDLCYLWKEGWKIFLTLFAWFMNPASLLPLPAPSDTMPDTIKIITESWLIYFLFLFQKLFAAVFYYEIIKTLRRFTK